MVDKIQKVIDEKVKPILRNHHGDIELVKVENNMVYVKLLGACGGCPSAQGTLEDIVYSGIKEEVEEIDKVILVNEIGDDIIDMAKKILAHKN